ncbi:MAG: di-heme oxidoredictase family protein [Myxococcota bacterium]|nr:di-heme oxidoredictase family protein [Myxococcota bacterium]
MILLLSLGCRVDDPMGSVLIDGEWLPGGEAGTNTLLGGSNSFIMPMPGLSAAHEQQFYSGNSYFNQSWVEAPASTDARDGLGPFFNARSCSTCHFKDGRAAPTDDSVVPFSGLLLRLSVSGPDGPVPDPIYGGQLQDIASPGLTPELTPRVTWQERTGSYPDGTPYALLVPAYHLDAPAHGPLSTDLMISPRLPPQVIGLGLLEAIPASDLAALADPDDADGDGISGRIPWGVDPVSGEVVHRRMGWKADSAGVVAQVAGALAADMGLTSTLRPLDDCTSGQPECLAEPAGGEPEVSDTIFERLVTYTRSVAVPARRNWDDPDVLAGRSLFSEVQCDGCHVADFTTSAFAPLPELSDQHIWPYSDLLLHDMGPDLADDRPVGAASGREWRTRPLWGIGLLEVVNGHTRLMHDGRADGVAEAILWHGGEAAASRDRFMALSAGERAQLVAFVEDL